MSAIEDQVLADFRKALEALSGPTREVAELVAAELVRSHDPNAERLADIYREATGEASA